MVTNLAAGISPTPLSHDEVAMAGVLATERLGRLSAPPACLGRTPQILRQNQRPER